MYPIEIRADGSYGRKLTFAEAVQAAMGVTGASGLAVTAVYAEDTLGGYTGRTRERVTYKAGDPVFGLEAQVYARRIRFGQDEDAQVTIGGTGSHSPEVAMARIACYTLAAQIAAAANAAAAAAKTPQEAPSA